MLYPSELLVQKWSTVWDSNPQCLLGRQECYHYTNGAFGLADRIRTCDLVIPNHAIYQTDIQPDTVVGGGGFEPPHPEEPDLQSGAFDRSAIRP